MATRQIRPIRVEGNIAYVPLTKGREAIIDVADVPLVEGFNWYANDRQYAVRNGMRDCTTRRATVRMHRVILGEPDALVDHINGNTLDNRRSNLRTATPEENARNCALYKSNTSGVKGVTWFAETRTWRARIAVGGKTKYLGYFENIQDAATAYAKASQEFHGAFGRAEAAALKGETT